MMEHMQSSLFLENILFLTFSPSSLFPNPNNQPFPSLIGSINAINIMGVDKRKWGIARGARILKELTVHLQKNTPNKLLMQIYWSHKTQNVIPPFQVFPSLEKWLMVGANIRLLRIYSNEPLFKQCMVFPLNTYSEVTCRLLETTLPFTLKGPMISYQYSDPIQLYKVQKQGNKIEKQATILVIDLGTTGLDCTMDKITEIAIRDVEGGEKSMFHTLVNPEIPLKNHKRKQILTDFSVPRMKEATRLLIKWVKSRQTDGKPVVLVSHNGHRFDFPFLVRALLQNGHLVPENWLFLDTLPIARQLHHPDGTKLEKGNHKLKDIVTFFGVAVEVAAHKAIEDVNALSSVLQHMTFFFKLTVTDLIKRASTPSQYVIRPHDNDFTISN